MLTVGEARAVIESLSGVSALIGQLLYGSGLRVMEACRLRVLDLDFSMHQLHVRDGKGAKDRVTMLPEALVAPMSLHLVQVNKLHQKDLRSGNGKVYLPFALRRIACDPKPLLHLFHPTLH